MKQETDKISLGSISSKMVYSIKSKFGVEFRRYSYSGKEIKTIDLFYIKVLTMHNLHKCSENSNENPSYTYSCLSFDIWYTDPITMDLLPISNNENYARALSKHKTLLLLVITKKGNKPTDSIDKRKQPKLNSKKLIISDPTDFRTISCLMDADYLPDCFIRVRLCKNVTDKKPIGLYIRSETESKQDEYMRNEANYKSLPGRRIFISRIEPASIADLVGVISVDDEVLEVNGITVEGKDIDQVVEMMIVNSHNLILTLKSSRVSRFKSLLNRQSTIRASSHRYKNMIKSNIDEEMTFDA